MGSASSVPTGAPSTAGTIWTKTLLLDDFSGAAGAAPSSSNWIIDTGTQYPGGPSQWGTGEIQTYTSSSSNLKQDGNGNLLIIPQRDSSGAWTSARIESSRSDLAAPANGKMRVEAKITMPNVTPSNGAGYWPAFWMLGGNFRGNYTNWPACGELDIMEQVNGGTNVNSGVHCGVEPGGPCNEPNGISQLANCQNSTCPGNPHVYEIIIDRTVSPEVVQYYTDRVLTHTISATTLGASTWKQTIDHGFFVLLNVAMGGSYPNGVAGTSTPNKLTVSGAPMTIDYVGVWTTS